MLISNFDMLTSSYPLILTFIWLFDLQVSFIRKRDLHILSAGSSVYTSDQRFQVSLESFNNPKKNYDKF